MKLLLEDLGTLAVQGQGLTLREAMSTVDSGGHQFALVLTSEGNLIGVVTDGDLRRALLKGAQLSSPLEPHINNSPITTLSHDPAQAARLARIKGVRQVVLGEIGKPPTGVFVLESSSTDTLLPPVMIMAGGKGVRLRPLTLETPKPLVEVGGVPILHRILESLSSGGASQVLISLNYMAEKIRRSVGDGEKFGLNISYLEEKEPLGTAGPLHFASKIENASTLIVLNADLLVDVDYSLLTRHHHEHENSLTIGVKQHITEIPYGVVRVEDQTVLGITEKPTVPSLVSAGVYCIDRSLFPESDQPQPKDMPDLINEAISSGYRVGAFPIHRRWIDIGTPKDLERANEIFG